MVQPRCGAIAYNRGMNAQLGLLVVCQSLYLVNNITFIAINGLVGLALAPQAWMATLPIMGYVLGGALSTGLVARTQRRWGRRGSFRIGLAVAFVSALGAAAAVWVHSFVGVCLATVVAGYYSANGTLYRFAAAELVAPAWREKAVSLLMAGGLVGAVVGPNLAALTRDWLPQPFVGAYVALAGVALLSMLAMSFIRFPPPPAVRAGEPRGRPLRELLRQPAFVVASFGGALAFGVMNLLMTATPLAMQVCGLPFANAAFVLQWHVIGMFAPGFFTGHLIRRLGALPVMAAGLALNLACVGVALSGVELHHFQVALFLLGVGWNFLFTGSTTLALDSYRPEEKERAQAFMSFTLFATLALTSFTAGVLVTTRGWQWLNLGSLLPVALIGASLLWLRLAPPAPAQRPVA